VACDFTCEIPDHQLVATTIEINALGDLMTTSALGRGHSKIPQGSLRRDHPDCRMRDLPDRFRLVPRNAARRLGTG
jgi:hypothetical protein